MKIRVEVSARHLHLTQHDLEVLFGDGYQLEKFKDLSQGGEFASTAEVTLVGPKRKIENVRVLGPCRQFTQIELARTDCFYLGVQAPLRLSGKIEGSGAIQVVGPQGTLDLKKGVIIAKRHIHVSDEEAADMGLKNGQEVSVRSEGPRSLVFDHVEVRVKDSFNAAVHLDTDEGNAAMLPMTSEGEIII
jgi:putative phosphotransacetylase